MPFAARAHVIGNKNMRVRDSVFIGVTDEFDRCDGEEPYSRDVDKGTDNSHFIVPCG